MARRMHRRWSPLFLDAVLYDNVNRALRTAVAPSPWQHRGSGEAPFNREAPGARQRRPVDVVVASFPALFPAPWGSF